MRNIELSQLVDYRNEFIYGKVKKKFDVEFANSCDHTYGTYAIGREITFYLPKHSKNINAFTHELLHGYIESFDVNIAGSLLLIMRQREIANIFDIELTEHIANSIVHHLMLPLYLQLGFDRTEFISDYQVFKAEQGLLPWIATNYCTEGFYFIPCVRTYIGKFFSFKADPNPLFNYYRELSELKEIDTKLYSILEAYYESWADYKFQEDTVAKYREINWRLHDLFEEWITGKPFIG